VIFGEVVIVIGERDKRRIFVELALRPAAEGPALAPFGAAPYALTTGKRDFPMVGKFAKNDPATIERFPRCEGLVASHRAALQPVTAAHDGARRSVNDLGPGIGLPEFAGRAGLVDGVSAGH